MLNDIRNIARIALVICPLVALSLPAAATKAHKATHHATKPVQPASDPDEDVHSTWTQDSSLASQLAPEYAVQEFTIRPPVGYDFDQNAKERDTDNVFVYTWYGTPRSDGSAPSLTVQLTKLKPDVVTIYTLDERLDQFFDDIKQKYPWIVNSPSQHGLINDLTFVRAYYKDGPSVPAGQPINHGFVYKATSADAKYLITMSANDNEPYNTTTMPLLEASVLTFKEK